MLLTLHLLLNNSTADGEGRKKAGTGCMSPTWSKWLSAKPAATSSHLLVADPCFRGSQQRAAAKNSSRSFSQSRYFTFVSNVANLIQTCIWQGQTQYTDVIKTTLSSMCKRNQFFAVSSHTPFLPLTLCYFVWNSHSLLTPLQSISTACLGQGNREPLTPTRAGAESWKPWKHTQTSHHRLWNNHKWHGWSWESSVSRTTPQLKLRSAQENINNQLRSASQDHKNLFISWHVRPLKLDFTLIPNPLMSSNP